MSTKRNHTKKSSSTPLQPPMPPKAPKAKKVWPGWISYLLLFIGIFVFSTFIYGDVFIRAAQDNFIVNDSQIMAHLTGKEWGNLFLFSRWIFLCFNNVILGGLFLSITLTCATFLLENALRLRNGLNCILSLIPFAILTWMVSKGTSLYYKNEPSLIVLIPLIYLVISIIIGTILKLRSHTDTPSVKKISWNDWFPLGGLLTILCTIILCTVTLHTNENEILTARMQNRILNNDIEGLVEDGLQAQKPTKSVAAYYAIGLLQTNQLLERLFEIPFKYPQHSLEEKDGSEEYGIFLADCNFYAGLINASYRAAMDQVVMNGPRLYQLKRMALCAIMNQEKELAQKYLDVINKVPFESDFVEKYQPMVEHPELIDQIPSFKTIKDIFPLEKRFEQNYRSPAFLGYNVGMTKGNNEALAPSIAACLYSKDLPNAIERAAQLKRLGIPLPMSVQEAIVIHGKKNPAIFKYFTELAPGNTSVMNGNIFVNDFFISITEYYQKKYNNSAQWTDEMMKDLKGGVPEEVREALKDEWLGHYVFYYYCENIQPKKEENQQKDGVN